MSRGHRLFKQPQSGFSIAEFMVAITIGMFLISGLVGMYIAGKASYNTNEAMARTQENARFATDILTRYLRLADYRPDNEGETLALLPSISNSVQGCIEGTNCGAGFAGTAELPPNQAAGSHALHIKYQIPYAGLRDCTGVAIADTDGVYTATFAIGRQDPADPLSLYCGSSFTPTGEATGPVLVQPLIQGVSDLAFNYGILTAGGTIKFTDQPAAAEWANVIVVRVLATVDPGDPTLSAKATEKLEARPDRQYQATIHLRNRLL